MEELMSSPRPARLLMNRQHGRHSESQFPQHSHRNHSPHMLLLSFPNMGGGKESVERKFHFHTSKSLV